MHFELKSTGLLPNNFLFTYFFIFSSIFQIISQYCYLKVQKNVTMMCMNIYKLLFYYFRRILPLRFYSFLFFDFFSPFSHLNFNIATFILFTSITFIIYPPILDLPQSTLLMVRVKEQQLRLVMRPNTLLQQYANGQRQEE